MLFLKPPAEQLSQLLQGFDILSPTIHKFTVVSHRSRLPLSACSDIDFPLFTSIFPALFDEIKAGLGLRKEVFSGF